ncbi:MAG: PilZ domain-containing protein [Spartobacteria bacterium]|nr:PilZ domain-containing protein [Spartobacteria bacterium]
MDTVDYQRQFIRHPSDIPITYIVKDKSATALNVKNLGTGGVCFTSDEPLEPGSAIHVSIPCTDLDASIDGEVAWCSQKDEMQYEIGVKFLYSTNPFHFRQVEQLCQIEHYRRDVQTKEGRSLTTEQAAREWIDRYAAKFPDVS